MRRRISLWAATSIVVLVMLAAFNFGCLQRRVVPLVAKSQPLGLYRLNEQTTNTVVLTIDDGPSSRTGELLDLLAEYNATATFFVHTDHIDQCEAGEAMIARMLTEGHEIGNHMPSDRPSIELTAEEFDAEFAKADSRLRELGAAPTVFRPASGAFSDETMGPTLDRHGYEHRYVLGSYLPWDVYFPAPKRYAKQLVNGAMPGAIFVLHDGDHHEGRVERTIETLRLLLAGLKETGYAARSLADARNEAGTMESDRE
ncbi:MAG: polysaccharide deacetylase family protein [Planctomycetota bacterium]